MAALSGVVLVLGALIGGGVSPAASLKAPLPSVTVLDSLATIRPQDAPTGSSAATISAAGNEFESFQIAVSGGVLGLRNMRVSLATPLTGPGGRLKASAVTIYREGYVDVHQPSDLEGASGRWPDPLIPAVDPFYGERRNAFPIDVPAGENRVAWVDVLVPPHQKPGTYHGTIAVTGLGFNDVVPVQLDVRGFSIPSTTTLKSSFGMSPNPCVAHFGHSCSSGSREGWLLSSLYVSAALDDRVSISEPFATPSGPRSKRLFRRYLLPLLRGKRGPPASTPRLPGARLTSLSLNRPGALAAWHREARRDKFVNRAFFYACDEPGSSAAKWSRCTRRARHAHHTWPNLPSLVTATAGKTQRHGADRLVDILVPLISQLDGKPGGPGAGDHRPTYNHFLRRRGKQLWMYNACPSFGCGRADRLTNPLWAGWPSYAIDQPATEQRAMGALAYEFHATGELYYDTTYNLSTAWQNQYAFGGNGDGNLFYPGTPKLIGGHHDIPIDSIRLKRIRDGHEDYEYLRLAQKRGHGKAARSIVRGLYPNMYSTNVPASSVASAAQQLAHLIG